MKFIIYKISDENKTYIGITCKTANQRLSQHKIASKININRPLYKYFNAVGWDKAIITVLLTIEGDNISNVIKSTLERQYIKLQENSLNVCIPLRSQKEYVSDNYDEINRKKNIKNKCSCGGKYTMTNYSHHIKTDLHKNKSV